MNPYEFGRALIETRDLDPVYVLVHKADLERGLLERWLLAYWCFYHVGTASALAEDKRTYWEQLQRAAANKDYPRASERRHFRGQAAIKSAAYLQSRGLRDLFDPLYECRTLPDVQREVQAWSGFGPWIAFKVADMLERLGLAPVKFTDDDIFSLYDAPREGAELMVKLHAPDKTVEPRVWALDRLKYVLGNWKAPPGDDRLIGVQEIETILCKWKSHKAGKYTVGKDIAEVGHALQFGGNTPLLRLMRGTFKTHLEATS